MAIQVGGTTVVDDSRVLQNVTGLKTVNSNSLLGSGDIAISANDEKADCYGYSAYRNSQPGTLYPGFNIGTYINFGSQGSMTEAGTFTNGSYTFTENYGSYQTYGSLAVRTG